MKKMIYKLLTISLIAIILVMAAPLAPLTNQDRRHSVNTKDNRSYTMDFDEGFDLSLLEQPLSSDIPIGPLAHTFEEMERNTLDLENPCADVKGTCLTPNACNRYKYAGYHYRENVIEYTQSIDGEESVQSIQTMYYSIVIDSETPANFWRMVREAARTWNEVRFYDDRDGAGRQIVQLHQVSAGLTEYNGLPVCAVSYVPEMKYILEFDPEFNMERLFRVAGMFIPKASESIRDLTGCKIELYIGWDLKTVVHEFGHLLGLDDLDALATPKSRCHGNLMGYGPSRPLQQCPDIQGAALFNFVHTQHVYYRHKTFKEDNKDKLRHYCFYCGGYKDFENRQPIREGGIEDSDPMPANPFICTHDYKPVASAGDTWSKCTKCYNLIYDGRDLEDMSVTAIAFDGTVSGDSRALDFLSATTELFPNRFFYDTQGSYEMFIEVIDNEIAANIANYYIIYLPYYIDDGWVQLFDDLPVMVCVIKGYADAHLDDPYGLDNFYTYTFDPERLEKIYYEFGTLAEDLLLKLGNSDMSSVCINVIWDSLLSIIYESVWDSEEIELLLLETQAAWDDMDAGQKMEALLTVYGYAVNHVLIGQTYWWDEVVSAIQQHGLWGGIIIQLISPDLDLCPELKEFILSGYSEGYILTAEFIINFESVIMGFIWLDFAGVVSWQNYLYGLCFFYN